MLYAVPAVFSTTEKITGQPVIIEDKFIKPERLELQLSWLVRHLRHNHCSV